MREVFYFIWWMYEGHPVTFYICLSVIVLWIIYTHVLAYQFGKSKQHAEDEELIEQLEQDNNFGVNSSLRIATKYDVMHGNYVEEDDPIYK